MQWMSRSHLGLELGDGSVAAYAQPVMRFIVSKCIKLIDLS